MRQMKRLWKKTTKRRRRNWESPPVVRERTTTTHRRTTAKTQRKRTQIKMREQAKESDSERGRATTQRKSWVITESCKPVKKTVWNGYERELLWEREQNELRAAVGVRAQTKRLNWANKTKRDKARERQKIRQREQKFQKLKNFCRFFFPPSQFLLSESNLNLLR